MAKHALLSASGAARWLECTPSAKLELQFPKRSSSYADEGTAAHELCELVARYWLGELNETMYEAHLAGLSKGQYYDTEMQECAMDYAKFILEAVTLARTECPDAIAELEVRGLDFSEWAPDGFGTGDCIIVADNTLEIIDFKYGKGYRVEAVNNPQMRLYALGAIKRYGALYDIKYVRMTIIQPRISREPSTEVIKVAKLLDWAENYVKPRAALAFAGQGDFCPGEVTCKFCRAKEQCKARADANLALLNDSPDSLLITSDDAASILSKAGDIKAWLSDLETFVMRTLFEGQEVNGWKLVEGRSNRRINDEGVAAAALFNEGYTDDQVYEHSLLSLTALEKKFGKKEVERVLGALITKPPGKPTLARADDKRAAFTPEALVLAAFDEE